MSDQPTGAAGDAPEPLTDEQAEWLRQQTVAQTQSAPNPASEQAAVASQMTQRGPALPAELAMDDVMALLKAQSDQIAQLSDQVGTMQKAEAERQAAHGGPPVARYATAALDKLHALAVAHPDLGKTVLSDGSYQVSGHFAGVVDDAKRLAEAAAQLADAKPGKRKSLAGELENAAGAVERFATRTHRRLTAKHIDWGAILGDVELAVSEGLKLAAAA